MTMQEKDDGIRFSYRKEGCPYFSYRYGEMSRGITRIGKWELTRLENNKWKKYKCNVTPKKIEKLLKTFTRWQRENMEFHLFLDPLPANEQTEWQTAFADLNVIYDVK